MKLAKLEPLAPGFVNGLKETHGRGVLDQNYEGRVKVAEAEAPPGEELEFATDDLEGGSPEEDLEAAVDIEKAEDEEGALAAEPEGELLSKSEILSVFEKALEELFPEEEVEVVGDEEDVEDVEAGEEFDPEGPDVVADIEVAGEEELQEGDEEELQEGDDEEIEEGKSDGDTDDIVEQITKRVAARILKSAPGEEVK